jgi:hypothetical protein
MCNAIVRIYTAVLLGHSCGFEVGDVCDTLCNFSIQVNVIERDGMNCE